MNILAIGISLVIIVVSVLFTPKKEVPADISVTSEEPKLTSEVTFTPVPATAAPSNVSQFQYPGSKTDEVDKITDWYKEKIKASGYNVTSFVTTKTNGQVLNKLVAAKSDGKIEVVITKSPVDSLTKIEIKLDNN